MHDSPDYGVFLGFDVGKGEHHAIGLSPDGTRLHDAAVHGRILVVVDQPASIGALPVTVARACGHDVAYLPGLAMRRIADLYPGTAKTDARDALVIADAARTLPHTLRAVDVGDETLAELEVLVGYDDDLAAEATRLSNRICGLLTGIHPALERALGHKITHRAVWRSCPSAAGPPACAPPGPTRSPRSPRRTHPACTANSQPRSQAALDEQTVTVPGTAAAETVLPQLAESLKTVLTQRDAMAQQVEDILDAHPLAGVLTSMPGIGVRTAARILLEVGDASSFTSAAHLAAYAGIAPVTHKSG